MQGYWAVVKGMTKQPGGAGTCLSCGGVRGRLAAIGLMGGGENSNRPQKSRDPRPEYP